MSKIIAGNWKMYKTASEARLFIHALIQLLPKNDRKVYLAVPFTAIESAVLEAENGKIWIGAQNMHEAQEGTFTGEISALMLKEAGAKFVLLGHSERRHLFGEIDARINKKLLRALQEGIQPILCIGETATDRDQGLTQRVLEKQIIEGLQGVEASALSSLILAYEPVWAIGTGRTATPQQAEEMHLFCRSLLMHRFGLEAADTPRLLYGGSVKLENVRSLLEQPNIDGVLVGGASLEVELFAHLIEE